MKGAYGTTERKHHLEARHPLIAPGLDQSLSLSISTESLYVRLLACLFDDGAVSHCHHVIGMKRAVPLEET